MDGIQYLDVDPTDPTRRDAKKDPLKNSMADHTRPDHFKQLLLAKEESHRVMMSRDVDIDTDLDDVNIGEENDESQSHDGSLIDSQDGEKYLSPSHNSKLQRQMTKKWNKANMNKDFLHVEVRLHDVSYHVPVMTEGPAIATWMNQSPCYKVYKVLERLVNCCKRCDGDHSYRQILGAVSKKTILRNTNLIFKPGKSYIILGPPGCGKTTLLQIIGGVAIQAYHPVTDEPLQHKSHVSGRIEYNGLSPLETPEMVLENVVSFVEQLDYHEPLLTVQETFDFARTCRTGSCAKSEGKVTENLTIDGLGLSYVADTYVGDSNIRGCSGGQRRRVTVGEMMQGENPVACADEISTGLDSASTYDMVRSIVHFAKAAGTTRIVSLLQPGPETFFLFDETVILSEGLVIYAGPIDEALEYFEDLGYNKPIAVDVADFLQSVSTPDGATMMDPQIRPDGHLTSEEFAEHWKSSTLGNRINNGLQSEMPNRWTVPDSPQGDAENPTARSTPLPERMKIEYQNSRYTSMMLIFHRFLTVWKRNRAFIIAKVIENASTGASMGGLLFLKGAIRYKCDPDDPSKLAGNIQDATKCVMNLSNAIYGGYFLFCFQILLGNATGVSSAFAARRVHYKQSDANFYQDISFVVGRLLSTLPMRLLECLAFGLPFYFFLGLDLHFESFILYLVMVLVFMTFANIFFQLLAMSLPTSQQVQAVSNFVLLVMGLFGGFIIYPVTIPFYLKWLYWINPLAWVYQGFLSIEFTSTKYDDTSTCQNPDKFLTNRGFNTGRDWIGWSFIIIFSWTALTTIVLSIVSKYVRFQEIKSNKKKLSEESNKEGHGTQIDVPFTKINLTFENICYDVQASTGDDTLRLLNNVSGAMVAGRMCALMGSSGAGKTTLMDVISLRKTSGEITGTVELNGFPQEKTSFLRSSGYVEQFDVQSSQLTVHETIIFSARLRLDSRKGATKEDASKLLFVDNVIEMMELTSLKNELVGDLELGTGLSFEQRKRLAIAVELAGSPSVLFLDEPTSGLDSRGAIVVMRAMKRIADTGRTICATIHQPSSAVFDMFDDLLLLKKGGALVFFGDLGENSINLTSYFESAGCEAIEYGQNPASWMLLASEVKEPTEWAELYTSSNQYSNLMGHIQGERESLDEAKKISFDHTHATTTKQRLILMSSRILLIYRRSPAFNLYRMMKMIIFGLLLAFPFAFKQNLNKPDGSVYTENTMESLFGTIFWGLLIVGIMTLLMVIPEVKKIRDVFYKHKASGMMEHHAVVFAIITGEMPYTVILSFLFSIAFYFLLGVFGTFFKFFQFFGFFLLNLANYTYFGQLFICLVKDIPTAMSLAGAIIGINILGTGFLIKPGDNPLSLMALYISPQHYCYEGIITNMFDGISQVVEPLKGSAYYVYLNCTPEETCLGDMEGYTKFAFGSSFSTNNIALDTLVPIAFLIVTVTGTHWALGHLNYVNT